MKKLAFTCCILFLAISMQAQTSLEGIWNTGEDNTKIEITEENEVYGGKIVSSDNAKAKIGNQLLKDVKFVDGEWKGKLYGVKKGKWFDAVLKEEGEQLLITVKGGIASKTLEWKKE